MTQIEKIKKIVAEQKPLLMKRYKVKEIGIFGSYVKGRETKRSDVDLLIEFQKSPGFIGFMEIENF